MRTGYVQKETAAKREKSFNMTIGQPTIYFPTPAATVEMKDQLSKKWIAVAFFNLLIVSALGFVLRFKISFALPWLDQKYMLNAHSHFAFTGWLSQALMFFIAKRIETASGTVAMKKYRFMLLLNLIAAYGMLFSFPFEGYAGISIFFSTLAVVAGYGFAFLAWKDLDKAAGKKAGTAWLKAALVFNALSSLGAFALGFMMAKHITSQDLYLSAIYFFLHFQYNGWFLFAALGLLFHYIKEAGIPFPPRTGKILFWSFLLAVVPTYFLSCLWMPLPAWAYTIIATATAIQCISAYIFIVTVYKNRDGFRKKLSKTTQWLWGLALLAFAIKILLQTASVVPAWNKFSYAFRPIVIAYLHLVFLGMLSIFLLGCYLEKFAPQKHSVLMRTGIWIFIGGIIFNELLLMLQGIGDMTANYYNNYNTGLLYAAIIMFSGLLVLNISLNKTTGVDRSLRRKKNGMTGITTR